MKGNIKRIGLVLLTLLTLSLGTLVVNAETKDSDFVIENGVLKQASSYGLNTSTFDNLIECISDFDIIINTVPCEVLTENLLSLSLIHILL